MNPGSFFRQFPKGCPKCKAPERLISFFEQTKGVRPFDGDPLGLLPKMLATAYTADSVSFAECATCHALWYCDERAGQWIDAE